ncbi:hypothetical protein PF007_g31011 [Phytophthora fragariae]|uniref:Uncharacterized protein n=1 Tax=Phytophthora fragariae TaxID=53985 RepID=A0A6A3PQD5_9STRA|nr:hypothetical protein PF003_g19983 [Phytophthora fragariae]KAE9059270.1 hypothetical protein PF007_g31011 [Phytophthora fragariae]KAE9258705.1 hypothetical protein PF001_g33272 [Phytophthora fragariae]
MTFDSRWSASHSGSARWRQASRATCVALVFGLPVDILASTGRSSAPVSNFIRYVTSRSLDGLQSATRCNGLT